MRAALCIPVYNPGPEFHLLLASLKRQESPVSQVLLVDSSPHRRVQVEDSTWTLLRIDSGAFDHGGTRRWAAQLLCGADILIFMTQDAVPADRHALGMLLSPFADAEVGAVFGRQIPAGRSCPFERHARIFNYPESSASRKAEDAPRLGIKTAFISDSFAAYRRSALEAVGGFPLRSIVSEDTFVAAKMLLAGWKTVYCAEAQVYHSHRYGLLDEFRRYFDVGVFHAREPWVREKFGGAEGEGWRFVRSELRYLAGRNPLLIPSSLWRTAIRYLGFRVGLQERRFPIWAKRRMSMQRTFWRREAGQAHAQGTG